LFLARELSEKLVLHWRLLKEAGEVEMVLRVKGTSWAGIGWRPRDLTAACKKFPVLADNAPAPDAELPAAVPQGRSLGAAAEAEPEPESEPEPETVAEPEPAAEGGNEAALAKAVESEGVGQQPQLPRNTR